MTMDTNNDGSYGTFKTVPALYNVTRTAPWTWHGWQTDLGAAVAQVADRNDARARAVAGGRCKRCWPTWSSMPVAPNPYPEDRTAR